MSSTFYGLNIAKTGLFTSQKGMELVGHNIANANTEGYTREVLNVSSIEGLRANGVITSGVRNRVGAGVEVNYIQQIRDNFLDKQYRSENSNHSNWEVKSEAFYYVENVFNEPSDSGISTVLNSFYSSLSKLAYDSSSKDVRNLVRQNAVSVCETINYYARQLNDLQKQQDDGIVVVTDEINTIVKEIADLNRQVVKYEQTGEKANDLNDKRNLLLDKLSALVDISYEYNDQNEVSVYFGKDKNTDGDKNDYCLLDATDNNAVYELVYEKNKPSHYSDDDTFHTLTISSKGGSSVEIDSSVLVGGELKGYFDLRDSTDADNVGIPYFMDELDALARGIVKAYNDVHNTGYTVPDDENGNVSQTGVSFFDNQGGDMSKVNALNMSVSDEVMKSVWNIAASSKEVDLSAINTQVGNNEIALGLVGVASDTGLDYVGNVDNFLASIVSALGVRAEQCNEMADNQELIVQNVDNLRMSASGVSLDEEVTNLITYQKAYQASSRVITAIDEMLDKLINGTGRVGL